MCDLWEINYPWELSSVGMIFFRKYLFRFILPQIAQIFTDFLSPVATVYFRQSYADVCYVFVRFVKLLPFGQWVFDKSRVRNISVFLRMEIICVHLCNLWELNLSVEA